jgi:hypothetical protein
MFDTENKIAEAKNTMNKTFPAALAILIRMVLRLFGDSNSPVLMLFASSIISSSTITFSSFFII